MRNSIFWVDQEIVTEDFPLWSQGRIGLNWWFFLDDLFCIFSTLDHPIWTKQSSFDNYIMYPTCWEGFGYQMYLPFKNFSKNVDFITLKRWKKNLSSNLIKIIPLYRELKKKQRFLSSFKILHSKQKRYSPSKSAILDIFPHYSSTSSSRNPNSRLLRQTKYGQQLGLDAPPTFISNPMTFTSSICFRSQISEIMDLSTSTQVVKIWLAPSSLGKQLA
jgi:hypothetical protein